MDEQELEQLEKLAAEHPELQELWDQHIMLKKQTDKLDSKSFLNPPDELKMKELKKEKLEVKTALVDMMQRLS